VYRGTALPAWDGQYIFGIFHRMEPNARIYAATSPASGVWPYTEIKVKGMQMTWEYILKVQDKTRRGRCTCLPQANGAAGTTGKVYKIVGE